MTTTELPDLCYVVVPGAQPGKRIGIVKRGQGGYYECDFDCDTTTLALVHDAVKYMNERLGVSEAQATAMRVGSMFGWDVPGADPAKYEEKV